MLEKAWCKHTRLWRCRPMTALGRCRQPLSEKDLITNDELKQKILEWRQQPR